MNLVFTCCIIKVPTSKKYVKTVTLKPWLKLVKLNNDYIEIPIALY